MLQRAKPINTVCGLLERKKQKQQRSKNKPISLRKFVNSALSHIINGNIWNANIRTQDNEQVVSSNLQENNVSVLY